MDVGWPTVHEPATLGPQRQAQLQSKRAALAKKIGWPFESSIDRWTRTARGPGYFWKNPAHGRSPTMLYFLGGMRGREARQRWRRAGAACRACAIRRGSAPTGPKTLLRGDSDQCSSGEFTTQFLLFWVMAMRLPHLHFHYFPHHYCQGCWHRHRYYPPLTVLPSVSRRRTPAFLPPTEGNLSAEQETRQGHHLHHPS